MVRSPAPKRIRLCEVRRKRLLPQDGGTTLFFTIHGIARRARFAQPHEVPEFEGEVAFFEVEQRNKTRLGYVFIRQVERPGYSLCWYG
jgi:hypothetical protein